MIRAIRNILCYLLTCFAALAVTGTCCAQVPASLQAAEKQMAGYLEKIRLSEDDNERELLNGFLFDALVASLSLRNSFDYPFDSLRNISVLAAPDKSFRLFTWNLPSRKGTHSFRGILQVPPRKGDSGRIIRLYDRADSLPDPTQAVLPASSWYGAVYYSIIPEELKPGEKVYTLLGWHGINLQIASRVIDVLSFSPSGEPVFGGRLFCLESGDRPTRVIFRYSANATMTLKYDIQGVRSGKKWNARRRSFEEENKKVPMIVCDRLVPQDPQLEGQYEFYLPASDVMDGFLFEKGCWVPVRDIDARNPEQKAKKPQAPPKE